MNKLPQGCTTSSLKYSKSLDVFQIIEGIEDKVNLEEIQTHLIAIGKTV